ncbi:uncharacterized protein B0T23DRAFT_30685 [Neurospora hispaniola]|uniref:Uncharacterized protein n=1 Tax=Neurospora hispaniola TaxID=588809 RepID=A0AAJ0IGG0_9PEZI|nr:hypothetical protein B0T23DRAFT_30685 [Neurospora hispaniola]
MGVSGAILIGMGWDMGYQSVFLTFIFTFLFCLVLLFAVCHLFLCSLQSESRTQSTTELHHNYIAVGTVAYRIPSPHLLSISAELLLQENRYCCRHVEAGMIIVSWLAMFVSPQCRRVLRVRGACGRNAWTISTFGDEYRSITRMKVLRNLVQFVIVG